ncbi:hypothetical protein ACWDUL_33660 [Nocardia niigatensis]
MTTAENEIPAQSRDPHTFEVLGRVMDVLCSTPGPLSECLTFRLWPALLADGGYVLAWCGVTPTEDEVVEYLIEAAANDEMTTTLRGGDVRQAEKGSFYTTVDVRGVRFQLRSEPMPQPEAYAAMSEYWRTGELTRLGR